ncbi:hypothetical protein LSH36_338g04058 [Paralvinella palmiformis]|uniref:Uncharacterized protein n=1 Tax=Paralvinella palmiformis TaxID=53620 RepID=A0AAD9JFD6_9ANNE|nr:hypothetical protein LSH36_338g04058 [Paralvinella palmiformis]
MMSSADYVAMDTVSEGMDAPSRPRSYNPGLGSPTLEAIGRRSVRSRPSSATTPTLAFSQRKVREINDPILQILHQLHKIIYITQLPPTLSPNPRRRIIGRYKRLLTGSRDAIDVDFGNIELLPTSSKSESSLVQREKITPTEQNADDYMESGNGVCLTYDEMQNVIERVLVETGYYDFTSPVRHQTVASGTLRSLSVPYHS